VQPENAEVLDAIRQHSRLNGYLEAGAPKGYLLIKQQVDAFRDHYRLTSFTYKQLDKLLWSLGDTLLSSG
jgi:hypothetical protein